MNVLSPIFSTMHWDSCQYWCEYCSVHDYELHVFDSLNDYLKVLDGLAIDFKSWSFDYSWKRSHKGAEWKYLHNLHKEYHHPENFLFCILKWMFSKVADLTTLLHFWWKISWGLLDVAWIFHIRWTEFCGNWLSVLNHVHYLCCLFDKINCFRAHCWNCKLIMMKTIVYYQTHDCTDKMYNQPDTFLKYRVKFKITHHVK